MVLKLVDNKTELTPCKHLKLRKSYPHDIKGPLNFPIDLVWKNTSLTFHGRIVCKCVDYNRCDYFRLRDRSDSIDSVSWATFQVEHSCGVDSGSYCSLTMAIQRWRYY